MGKVVGWIGILGLAAVLLAAGLWTIARLSGPDEEQREALALLQADWDPPGENAFDALWLLAYPLPERELAAITDADMAVISAIPPMDEQGEGGVGRFTSAAARRFPDQTPSAEDRDLFCRMRSDNCLERVRADLPGYRALLDRHAPLLERAAMLEGYGHVRNRMPPRIDAPFPHFNHASYRITRHALAFADGEVESALDGACRDFDTWRRLGANSDMLIASMVGNAYSTDGNGRLVAGMLRELPVDHPLPASCRAALRPAQPGELSLCQAMRGEFAMSSSALTAWPTGDDSGSGMLRRLGQKTGRQLLLNPEKTRAQSASYMAGACTVEQGQKIVADQPGAVMPPVKAGFARFECIDNPIGCILVSIAWPAYGQYHDRMLDQGARLQVLGTLLWLRDNAGDDRPLAERIASRPAELRSPARAIEVGEDGRSLRIRHYDTRGGKEPYWEVPLPDALFDAPPDAPPG